MKPTTILKSTLVLALATIAACGGGGGGSGLTLAEKFVKRLNEQDTFYNYKLVKDPTKQAGYIVVDDGYEYRAIDVWDDSWDLVYFDELDYFDNESFHVTYVGNGYYEDSLGYLYETTEATSKDLEKVRGFMEDMKAQKLGEKLAAEYGLSEERGTEIAKVTAAYNKASEGRAMTEKDAAAFSTEILGFDVSAGIKAMKKAELEGDRADLDQLIKKAAETNGISPEQVNEIMKKTLNE